MTAEAATISGAINLHEGDTAPGPPSTFQALLYKRSGVWYSKDGAGVEAAVTGGVTSVTAGAGLTGGGSGAVTVDVAAADGTIVVNANSIQVGTIGSANITDGTVANADLANMGALTVKGSVAGGVPADLTPAQVTTNFVVPDGSTLEISGSTIREKDAGTTNAKLANMVQQTIKGRAVAAGTGAPVDLTGTQATAILDDATFTLPGRQTAAEKIAQNSMDGRTSTGTNPRVFRPGDYMQGNVHDPTGALTSTSFVAMMAAVIAWNDRCIIELPPGVFKVTTGTLAGFTSASCSIRGPGRGHCVFVPTATGDFITLPNALTGSDAFTVSGFTIINTSGTPFTTGAGIAVNGCDNVLVSEVGFVDLFYDVNVTGAAIKVSIQKTVHYQTNGSATSVGVRVSNGAAGDTYIGPDVVMSNGGATRRRASVELIETGHYEITQCNLTGSAQGILIDPGAAQIVAFGFHTNVLCDSCSVNGMSITAPSATSTVKNIHSVNSWYSGTTTGAGLSGVVTSGTAGGIINGISFDNDRFFNNQRHGFEHGFGTDFSWSNCEMRGNNAVGANLATGYDGLNIAANVSNWRVLGGKYGGTDTAPTGGNQRWGIFIAAGASTSASIIGADLSGNGAGSATPGGPLSNGSTARIAIHGQVGMPIVPAATPAFGLITAAAETYVTPAFSFPAGSPQVGMGYKCNLFVTNTATAQTTTIRVKFGTAGTTADGNVLTLALSTGTATIGTACTIEIICYCKAIGSGTTSWFASVLVLNGATTATSTTGFTNQLIQSSQATVATFNSTVANFLGVSLAPTTANIVTVQTNAWEELAK